MTTQQQGQNPDTSPVSAICVTAIACPTQVPFCPPTIIPLTWFNTCGVPPATLWCNQQAQGQAVTIGNTGWYTCGHVPTCGNQTKIAATTYTQFSCGHTQIPGCIGITQTEINCAPTHLLGCTTATANPDTSNAPAQTIGNTGWHTCVQTPACGNNTQVAATTYTQGPTHLLGCTGWHTCGQPQTMATVCTQIQCPPNAAALGSPAPTTTVQPTHLMGCTGWQTCGHPGTAATVCTQTQQAAYVGNTGWYTCGHQGTAATVCTQITCGHTNIPGCTTVTSPPNTLDCPQAMGAAPTVTTTVQHTHVPNYQIGYTGWYTCGHQGTAATVCTQTQQAANVGNTGWYTCGHQGTAATTCTQINCAPTNIPGCTTITSPPSTLDCPQAMGAAPTATTTVQHTYVPNCQIGYTGWHTCGQQGTAATVCTQTQQAANVGNTGWNTCGHQGTAATVCTQHGCGPTHRGCAPTHKPGCVGQTGWYTCTQANNTEATVCTQIDC